jgi:hypothetical protein
MEKEKLLEKSKRTICQIWTRAMGYCRPVDNFNKGKKSEFAERKYFTEEKTMEKINVKTNSKKKR